MINFTQADVSFFFNKRIALQNNANSARECSYDSEYEVFFDRFGIKENDCDAIEKLDKMIDDEISLVFGERKKAP